jgi:phage-related protein (TIGR01555 family)
LSDRKDGYINVLNNFGTQRDSSNAYQYEPEGMIPDMDLTMHYESDGLFSRIINYPAEEALKHGYDFDGLDDETKKLINKVLDYIDWDESVITALKWSRLYGGSIIVMMIDDGGNLDEPLNYDAIRDIDELRVYERAIVTPDYTTMYNIGAMADAMKHKRSNFGMPEWYYVFSQFGSFRVHESRCLVFRNGRMPERTSQALYRFWGTPEYLRIRKKMQEADTSASYAVKLLERAVQRVYKMKGLSDLLTTDSGESDLLKRLQTIDLSVGILNSMVIDAEGEDYVFQTAQLAGVQEIIDSTCGMLSAVTGIAQTVLFGRSPSGMNATGESDMDNTYAMVERLQTTQVRRPFEKLMDIIMLAAQRSGKLAEIKVTQIPEFSIKFNPLKTVSEMDQAQIDQLRATTQQIRAQTSQTYVDLGAVDPSEVRRGLGKSGEYDVEAVLDDLSDEELLEIPSGGGEDEPMPEASPQPVQVGKQDADFNEGDHPRAENGQFGSGNGGGSSESEEKSSGNTQEGVANSDQSGIIEGQKQPGARATAQQKKAINDQLRGKVAKDGRVISDVSSHACDRMVERGIPESAVEGILTSKESMTYPGNKKGTACYQKNDIRIVVSTSSDGIVTVVDLAE